MTFIDTGHGVIPAVAPHGKTPADVLRHAARVIEERGWHQGDAFGPSGAVCAWGGIRLAIFGDGFADDPLENDLELAATTAMAEWLDDSDIVLGVVALWNDDPARTADDVTSGLRAAADAWEAAR